ncbi:MAG: hypothetical protein JST55_05195 [Bacteroidetes bacterium]|nr:hypothetical protein [Bacteroidota bacterium]
MKTAKNNKSKSTQAGKKPRSKTTRKTQNKAAKKSRASKKIELTKAEEHDRKVRLIRTFAPLCGRNYQRLVELTGLNYTTVRQVLYLEKYKDIKDVFDKSERIDHQTEMWHAKTLKLKNAIPICNGTYKDLASLADIPVVTVKTYVNDPRNEQLKIALDERRSIIKLGKEKVFNERLIEAIKKFGSDIKEIAKHIGHEENYTYKLIKNSELPEVHQLITKARAEEDEKRSSPQVQDFEKHDPDFEIDSQKHFFLPHQIEFAYLAPNQVKHPAIVGGFGSGKTMSIPLRWLKLIEFRMAQGKKCDMMVLEPTTEMMRDIIVPTFDEFFERFGIPVKFFSNKKDYIITYKGQKHTCMLRSADRPRSLTGKNLSDIIIDEFDRIPYYKQKEVWRECISRIRKTEFGTCAVVTTPDGYKMTYELWGQC